MWTWDDLIKAKSPERRRMWVQLQEDLPEAAEYWGDGEACNEDIICQYYKDGWCSLQELPAAFNPYLTPRTGMIGMACMGLQPPQQIEMSLNT